MTQFLKKHFKGKPLVGAEIGVLNGDHVVELLETLNIERLYLIDPYCAYEDYHDHNRHGLAEAREEAVIRLAQYGNRIQWIFRPSDKAAKFIHRELDFVYFDGNHAKPYIYADLWNYLPSVKKDGVFGGHDYYTRKDPENLCEVKEVVDEFHELSDSTLYLDGSYEHDWPDWWFVKDERMIESLIKMDEHGLENWRRRLRFCQPPYTKDGEIVI